MVKYQQVNLHDGHMVIHCTTLSSFLYILKCFIIVKKKRHRMFFPQVIPLSLAIQQSTTTTENYYFIRKTLLLVIQTHDFPKGTVSLLPQKMFMVSQIPTAPTSQHTQALVYERLGFNSVYSYQVCFPREGRRKMEVKDKITHGLFALCLSSDIKQFNKEIPSCQQILVSITAKENNVI